MPKTAVPAELPRGVGSSGASIPGRAIGSVFEPAGPIGEGKAILPWLTWASRVCRFDVDTPIKSTIQRWGKSLAVRIPKTLAQETAFDEGDVVDLRADDDRVVIERLRPTHYRLSDLLAGVTNANRHEAVDLAPGEPGGLVVPRRYAPDRGDVVWLQFTPQAGHEQAGRRPAVTLSPRNYNEKVGQCGSLRPRPGQET